MMSLNDNSIKNVKEYAIQCFKDEAQALLDLIPQLDENFEKSIDLKEDAKNFRYNLISQLGAYALDNAGKTIVYSEVFPELIKRLQESFRNEQKKVIQNIAQNLVFFEAELEKKEQGKKMTGSTLSDKNREQIMVTLKNLTTQYHYTQSGAMSLMKYLIKELY